MRSLEEQRIKFAELQNILENKAIELNQEVDIKIQSHIDEIKSLKTTISEHEESAVQKLTEMEKLANDLMNRNEEIKNLESDLQIKSEDIQTMNEEVMSKYKIIEELQSQIDSNEHSNVEEKELNSTIDSLKTEILDLKTKNECQTVELSSRANALERLQTVFDVCQEQSESIKTEIENKTLEIAQLTKENELMKAEKSIENIDENKRLNLQIDEMSITLSSLQSMKETYEEKIRTLENENCSLEELSIDIAEYRKQILSKDAEIDSLQEKLEAKTLELSKKDVEIFDDRQSQIGKLFEKHDIEQVEMLQKQLKEKDEFYEKQKIDLIEKHRLQIEEKDEFVKSSKIDDTLQSKLEEINSLLQLKTQEIEQLNTTIDILEKEKNKLELKMVEIEQFRQEVAKEANQHMEETGDKMRGLKTQFENKQEEVNQLLIEKEESDSSNKKITDELKSLQSRYDDALQNSSNSDIIKEKHLLKEKNEKLTNMCKKYLAKLKQQEVILKEKEGMVENDKIEEYNNKISNFEKEINQAKSENEILMEEMTSKYQIIEDLQHQLTQREAECEKWERESSEKEKILIQKEIEKHRLQIEEKDEFVKSSKIDDTLQSKLEEINSLLQLKTQEIEQLNTTIDILEKEKNKLELKMVEIEQFRQEVAKEANQHMEETGDKMRELKTQFENKQEEVNQLLIEKEESDSSNKKITDELKSLQSRYDDALQNSSNSDIIKEKHLLKEKNEKLTN